MTKRERTTISLPPSLLNEVKKEAERKDENVSRLVRYALTDYLNKQQKQEGQRAA